MGWIPLNEGKVEDFFVFYFVNDENVGPQMKIGVLISQISFQNISRPVTTAITSPPPHKYPIAIPSSSQKPDPQTQKKKEKTPKSSNPNRR